MGKFVTIHEVEFKPVVKDDVIKLAEQVLEAAKSGRFHALSVVAITNDGFTFTKGTGGNATQTIGALEILKLDIINSISTRG